MSILLGLLAGILTFVLAQPHMLDVFALILAIIVGIVVKNSLNNESVS